MKTVTVFLLGAIVGVGGIYLYHKYLPPESKTVYALDLNIQNGERVLLKDPNQLAAFKQRLQDIDHDGDNGTVMNIKALRNDPTEVEGPLAGGDFRTPNRSLGPRGSMHNTQRVNAKTIDDVKSVLDFLAVSLTGTSPTPTPTPGP